MTSGAHDDGELGEIFLKLGKQGSTLAGVMDAFSIAVSIGLQYGVPLETYVSKFTNLRFEPAGLTDDPDVRMSQSIMDYIFRRLALDYMSFEDRSGLGIYSAEERQRHLETGSYEPVEETGSASELIDAETVAEGDRSSTAIRWSSRPATTVSKPPQPIRKPTSSTPEIETKDTHGSEQRAGPGRESVQPDRPHQRRAHGADHRHRRRLPALHDLRHQDAPRRLLLRLRGLRQHQRLQLSRAPRDGVRRGGGSSTIMPTARAAAVTCPGMS